VAAEPNVEPLDAGREELDTDLEAADQMQTGASAQQTGFQQPPQSQKRSSAAMEETALPSRRVRLRMRRGSNKPAAPVKAFARAGPKNRAGPNGRRLNIEDSLAAKDRLLEAQNAELLEARAEIAKLRDEVALANFAAARATATPCKAALAGAPLPDFLAAMAAPVPPAAERPSCVVCRMTPSRPKVAVLCGHFACEECWGKWLALQFSCPICRKKVRPANLVRLKGWGEG